MPKRKYSSIEPRNKKYAKRVKRSLKGKSVDRLASPYATSRLGLIPGFPKKFKFNHKYATKHNMSSTTVASNIVFRCNGMFDPDFTAVGHQPLYFDQIGAIYNHFYVVRSKIKYTIVPQGTTAQAPYRAVAMIKDTSTATLDLDQMSENNTSITRVCTGGINPTKEVISLYYDGQKTWGPALLSNSRQRGTVAQDPSEQIFFELDVQALDGTSAVDVHVLVEIEYTAVWDERTLITKS